MQVDERPARVSSAITLLWMSFWLSATREVFSYIALQEELVPEEFPIYPALIGMLLFAILIANIAVGRNWARIAFLVLFALLQTVYVTTVLLALWHGKLSFVAPQSFPMAVAYLASACMLIAQIAALWFLFTQPGAAWFRRGVHRSTST